MLAKAPRVKASIRHSILHVRSSSFRTSTTRKAATSKPRPERVGPGGAKARTRAVVEPKTTALWLVGWDLQPLSPPDLLHPLRPFTAQPVLREVSGDAPIIAAAIPLATSTVLAVSWASS